MANRKIQRIRGTDYVYIPYAEWDAEKHRNVRKRRYIGKMEDGRFVPNRTHELAEELRRTAVTGPEEVYGSSVRARLCGLTEFLDILSSRLGVADDLEGCFPADWKAILSLAYYLGVEFTKPLNRFHRWALTHEHPAGGDLDDEQIIALMKRIHEDKIREFLRRQVKRRAGRSVTVYAHDFFLSLQELAVLVLSGAPPSEYPRQKLLTVYSGGTGLPCGCFAPGKCEADRPLSMAWLEERLADFGVGKPAVVASERFLESGAAEWMLERGWHFILQKADPLAFCEAHFGGLRLPEGKEDGGPWRWNEMLQVFEQTKVLMLPLAPGRNGAKRARRVWAHIYFDPAAGGPRELSQAGRESVASMMGDYADSPRVYYHTFAGGLASKFGVRMAPNGFIWSSLANRGLFVLITNAKKSAYDALNAFRKQDFQYEIFSNLCERMYLRPFSYGGSEPEPVLRAQIFLQFLGLVFFDATRREHSRSGLWAEINHTNLLDELDTIQRYSQPGKGSRVSALTPYQKEIYRKLGIRPPGSGWRR